MFTNFSNLWITYMFVCVGTTAKLKDKWVKRLDTSMFFYLIETLKYEKSQYPLVLLPVFCYTIIPLSIYSLLVLYLLK